MSAKRRPCERDYLAGQRVPPQAVDAEQSVLGGLMIRPESLPIVQELLSPEDFYRRDHQVIYRGICALADKLKPFDAVTLGDWFDTTGQADLVANGAYLIELAASVFSVASIRHHAELIAEKALMRRLIEAGTEMVRGAFEPDGREYTDLLAEAQRTVIALQLKQRGGLRPAAESMSDWVADLERRYESGGKLTGLPTPWAEVNNATHGLQNGELTLVPARPSMGKSILGGQLAAFTALRGRRVALFSLEMTTQQVHRRNVAALGNIPHEWLLAPDNEGDYWGSLHTAAKALKSAPLYVDDTSDLTIGQVMARARMLHLRERLDLIVVDHIHDFRIKAAEARFEYGRIAQGLKTLAKEFDCPVVALAQLNRGAANRADKRPTMTDLRESGELEQKADMILFVHREDYYDPNAKPGAVELILAKGRDIEAGKTITLRNDYRHMALRDWEGDCPPMSQAPRRRDRWSAVPGLGQT